MKRLTFMPAILIMLLATLPAGAQGGGAPNGHSGSGQLKSLRIGNFLVAAPCGIAFIVDNAAAFVLDTGAPYYAGPAAPDDSWHHVQFMAQGATVQFDWGRVGSAAVARLISDRPVELPLRLSAGWPGFSSVYTPTDDGATGQATVPGSRTVTWQLHIDAAPLRSSDKEVVVALRGVPVHLVAGLGTLPALDQVDNILAQAQANYQARCPAATGDWGDFVEAIADNVNNSRLYSSDNHRLAHSVSRGWAHDANSAPYFCWDSFFTAVLACLDDPNTARETVRAILSYQTPEGLVPNFAHWPGSSNDRSQPPVGALCVWKIQQRWPDAAFLREVYPKLVKWHRWWPQARDGNHNGLLEWGSATGVMQNALYETGWDDTLEFDGARMVGHTMNADAVDLNALWTMDAEYLARIADRLGFKTDAAQFRAERQTMIRRINDRLWNEKLGIYCSRLWDGADQLTPVAETAFGPGFEAVFYKDETLQQEAAQRHDDKIDFAWNGAAPLEGVSGTHWSARWTGNFMPPTTGKFRFHTVSDDGVRVLVGGHKVLDAWTVHAETNQDADVDLVAGQSVSVVVEYFQHEFGSVLRFSVATVHPGSPDTAFLTRLTPMNFYPLIAGIPDQQRAQRVLSVMTDPHKFWGTWILPTLAYDDPNYPQQNYWRGKVWGPVNYLVWQGLQRYASPQIQEEFARKSVTLFMRNWTSKQVCGENYLSTTGEQSSDPHYTWGALLNLVGVENLCDITPDGTVQLNGTGTQSINLMRVPLGGRLYDVRARLSQTELLLNGKVVLTARHQVRHAKLPQ